MSAKIQIYKILKFAQKCNREKILMKINNSRIHISQIKTRYACGLLTLYWNEPGAARREAEADKAFWF